MLLRASHVIKTASLASSRAAFFGTAAATRDAASADPPWKDTFATKPSADVRQGLRKERKNDRELEIDARWNKCALLTFIPSFSSFTYGCLLCAAVRSPRAAARTRGFKKE